MKKLNVEAIVLKNVNYKDSHRIYTLLSRERGKISAIARGVRKISSKRAGSLDSLNLVELNLSEDKSGFYSVNEVQVKNSYAALKSNLDYIFIGMYFAELVDVFLEPSHENYEIYRLLKSSLNVLSKNPTKPQIVVNVFEVRLLEKLGIGVKTDNTHESVGDLLSEMKNVSNLSYLMSGKSKFSNQVNNIIKSHLKIMVETYGRFPRLNKFLSDTV